jgi:hypothetical protein
MNGMVFWIIFAVVLATLWAIRRGLIWVYDFIDRLWPRRVS